LPILASQQALCKIFLWVGQPWCSPLFERDIQHGVLGYVSQFDINIHEIINVFKYVNNFIQHYFSSRKHKNTSVVNEEGEVTYMCYF
jgi:hypothetical protein